MSYQVFARKYRPRTFDDVLGQDHVVQTLKNAIEQNRLAHAYLFVGPRGTGKTSTARIFAKALNCPNGPSVHFDPNDPVCLEIAEGRNLDVLEIDGASNNGVDQVRDLRDNVQFAPTNGKFRIIYIDEVHMLSKQAFNALLKTLEEPPAHVKFIFATTEPHKILPTILSRCQRFDLRPLSSDIIAQQLLHIAQLEGITLETAGAYAVAKAADGGMRDAESMLDQLVAFCGNSITEEQVSTIFGLTSKEIVGQAILDILSQKLTSLLQLIDQQLSEGRDLAQFLDEIISTLREILISKVESNISLQGLSEEKALLLYPLINQTGTDKLLRLMDLLSETQERIKWATNKRLPLEIGLIKAIHSLQEVNLSDIIKAFNGAPLVPITSQNTQDSGEQLPLPQDKISPVNVPILRVAETPILGDKNSGDNSTITPSPTDSATNAVVPPPLETKEEIESTKIDRQPREKSSPSPTPTSVDHLNDDIPDFTQPQEGTPQESENTTISGQPTESAALPEDNTSIKKVEPAHKDNILFYTTPEASNNTLNTLGLETPSPVTNTTPPFTPEKEEDTTENQILPPHPDHPTAESISHKSLENGSDATESPLSTSEEPIDYEEESDELEEDEHINTPYTNSVPSEYNSTPPQTTSEASTSLGSAEDCWQTILKGLLINSPIQALTVEHIHAKTLENDILTVSINPTDLAAFSFLKSPANQALISQLAEQTFQKTLKVVSLSEESAALPTDIPYQPKDYSSFLAPRPTKQEPKPQVSDKTNDPKTTEPTMEELEAKKEAATKAFYNDPLIQEALEIFQGQIISH